MRRDVEFASEGTTCRAWLYTPDDSSGGRRPAVVMAHVLAVAAFDRRVRAVVSQVRFAEHLGRPR